MQTGQNERRQLELSDEQLERIAKRAAEIVTETVYIEVGKQSLRAVVLVMGSVVVALGTWFGVLDKLNK